MKSKSTAMLSRYASLTGLKVCLLCSLFISPLTCLAVADTPATNRAAKSQLDEIRSLANSGAALLAVQLIDEIQPDIPRDKEHWMLLERERVKIYQDSQNWAALTERLTAVPRKLPKEFMRWARTEQAYGFIKMDDGQKALSVLQDLVWNYQQDEHGGQWLSRWRHMIMESYLSIGAVSDAHTASIRYFNDYKDRAENDQLLRARILLMSGHADQVVDMLVEQAAEPDAGMLYLLAQLRSNTRPAKKVMQAGLRQMRGDWVKSKLKSHLWAVVAEAAQRSGDRATTANALEHVMAGQKRTPLPEGLFDFKTDSLWNAYIDFATFIGNKKQYLIGDDSQWFKAAAKARKRQPVRARSFYALLMLKGESAQSRDRAVKKFIALMRKRRGGANLMQQLFLDSRYFKDYAVIPEPARHELADIALARSNIQLASDLMASIKTAPDGADNYFWTLRRARIFVLGGDTEQGVKSLQKLLSKEIKWDSKKLEKLLQVVFDLQTVDAHQQAYKLFEQIGKKTSDEKLKRELYYWMAESQKAAGNFSEAARLYMKSAMYIGEDAMDPWAQTARYQAAESLAKAGVTNDARVLYSKLLKVTKEPARRAVLQHELQKLWLLDKAAEQDEIFETIDLDEPVEQDEQLEPAEDI